MIKYIHLKLNTIYHSYITHPAQIGQRGQFGHQWWCESRENLDQITNKKL